MENNKISSLADYKQKKQKKERKMLLLVIFIGILLGLTAWRFYVDNAAELDINIPPSQNITYNDQSPQPTNTTMIANEFEQFEGKPILLYIYTTWCTVCKHNYDIFNEIAREFQNTPLHIISLSVDRDIDADTLQSYFAQNGNLYFEPKFLTFKEGFKELLKQKGINYEGRIPFTVLLDREGKIVAKYVGVKNKNYLRNKIIKVLQ